MNKTKSTLPTNPLKEDAAFDAAFTDAPIVTAPEPINKKVRFSTYLSEELQNRVKNCVFHERGLTVSDLCEAALTAEIERRERELGQPFPQRDAELKAGRPIK